MRMRDVMIAPVICAEEWQTLAHACQAAVGLVTPFDLL